MNNRLKKLRNSLGLSQKAFSKKINIGQSTLAMFETGQRTLKDIHISLICSEFNVNEKWLRYGEGKKFIQPDEFSLDEYAQKNNLSALELDILKGYMTLDEKVRKELMTYLTSVFNKHLEEAATKEEYINKEVENYRLELNAELKGETSSVSENVKEKLN